MLSRDEIEILTGLKRPTAQARWLHAHNWIFETDRKGWPNVSRAFFDARMTGAPLPSAARVGPNRNIFAAA